MRTLKLQALGTEVFRPGRLRSTNSTCLSRAGGHQPAGGVSAGFQTDHSQRAFLSERFVQQLRDALLRNFENLFQYYG